MPGASARSFAGRAGSTSSSGMRTVNGTSRMRSQIPSSVPRTSGLWLVASQTLNSGRKSNHSACRKRAVRVSPPVIALTRLSSSRRPSSVSETVTNRVPFSRARSFGMPSKRFASSRSFGAHMA